MVFSSRPTKGVIVFSTLANDFNQLLFKVCVCVCVCSRGRSSWFVYVWMCKFLAAIAAFPHSLLSSFRSTSPLVSLSWTQPSSPLQSFDRNFFHNRIQQHPSIICATFLLLTNFGISSSPWTLRWQPNSSIAITTTVSQMNPQSSQVNGLQFVFPSHPITHVLACTPSPGVHLLVHFCPLFIRLWRHLFSFALSDSTRPPTLSSTRLIPISFQVCGSIGWTANCMCVCVCVWLRFGHSSSFFQISAHTRLDDVGWSDILEDCWLDSFGCLLFKLSVCVIGWLRDYTLRSKVAERPSTVSFPPRSLIEVWPLDKRVIIVVLDFVFLFVILFFFWSGLWRLKFY